MNTKEDTIVARATPAGEGAIAVIRISGPDAIVMTDSLFVGSKKLADAPGYTIHYGKIIDDPMVIDDVLVSVFRAPHSYTGENSIELSCHGNQLLVQKIIGMFLKMGARSANPGEFTLRAFLNGKVDLAQAEAVAEVIHSRTDASLKGARNQLDGMLSRKVNQLRESLVSTSALVELELDFAEEDIEFVPHNQLVGKIDDIISEIEKLLDTYSFGKVIKDGVHVALVGAPNVGKSSLLNYILKEYRAIVSSIPGTTRDIIREEVSIDGFLFELTDTAGIRITEDEIEIEGVKRSRETVQDADLVLFINDARYPVDETLKTELSTLSSPDRIITVINKIDLLSEARGNGDAAISAKTGEGVNELFHILKERALKGKTYTEQSLVITSIRHFDALTKSRDFLLKAKESAEGYMSGEFVAVDLRNAENTLSEIIGEVTSDDILNSIFDGFCIGK